VTRIEIDHPAMIAALKRLLDLARSDTGQSARVARFLMAWWNGPDLGDFPIADLFGLDRNVAGDITTVIGFLGQHDGAIYIDSLGYRAEMVVIVERWATLSRTSAEAA
jgi:hypothetical protein